MALKRFAIALLLPACSPKEKSRPSVATSVFENAGIASGTTNADDDGCSR